MGILKKSTPKKTQTVVVPDLEDGTAPFIKTSISDREHETDENTEPGQLAVDVFQTVDEIVVVAPIAGVSIDDISISITEGVLTISGRRNLEFAVPPGDYFTQECFWGNFARSVILPEDIDASSVNASFKDGILTVRVPKVEKVHTRMVEIREE